MTICRPVAQKQLKRKLEEMPAEKKEDLKKRLQEYLEVEGKRYAELPARIKTLKAQIEGDLFEFFDAQFQEMVAGDIWVNSNAGGGVKMCIEGDHAVCIAPAGETLRIDPTDTEEDRKWIPTGNGGYRYVGIVPSTPWRPVVQESHGDWRPEAKRFYTLPAEDEANVNEGRLERLKTMKAGIEGVVSEFFDASSDEVVAGCIWVTSSARAVAKIWVYYGQELQAVCFVTAGQRHN